MHIIVVGGDLLGASFVALAVKEGHDVTLIEADAERAESLAERFDVRVLHASIGEGEILEEAGADQAQALVATTHDDSANLMAMVLGREAEIASLVTVVNEKHHQRLFDHLGVQVLVDPEVIVARHLYGLVCRPDVSESVVLPSGGQVFEVVVAEEAPLAGRAVAEAAGDGTLDPDLVVIWRYHDGEGERVTGETRLEAGDRVIVFAAEPPTQDQLEPFGA